MNCGGNVTRIVSRNEDGGVMNMSAGGDGIEPQATGGGSGEAARAAICHDELLAVRITLERILKMRNGLALLVLLNVAWLVSGHDGVRAGGENANAPEVRAQRFVVVDDSGKGRGEFGMRSNGEPVLRLWDRDVSISAMVEMDAYGMPRVAFETKNGTPLAELGVLDKRHPIFVLRDADGNRRLAMVVAEAGDVAFGLYDTDRTNRCSLSLDKKGDPRIVLRDKTGEVRARVMQDEEGGSAVDLLDAKGRAHVVFQVDAKGRGDGVVFGSDERPVWSAVSGKP